MTELRAGPLRMLLDGADLRYVRMGHHEVVRRLYVAVRDRSWNTVPPELSNLVVERRPDSFRVSFTCSHRQDAVDFVWDGTVTGASDGTIRYAMCGQALSTFERARIGICVLHPIEPCAGASFRVTHPDGTTAEGVLPRLIAPHQPVMEMTAFGYPIATDGWAEFQFEGDVFEMEDQRNWTDASFKTYSTPLRLPMPVEVASGARIDQAVSLTIRPAEGWAEPEPRQNAELVMGEPDGRRLPSIGLGLGDLPLTADVLERLRLLNLAHLRLDLRLDDDTYPTRLQDGAQAANDLGVPLEIALTVGDSPAAQLAALHDRLATLDVRVARWLAFQAGTPSTPPGLARLVREQLGTTAPVGGGCDTHFTELNRHRPPLEELDFVCYPIMPQAHAFDERSIVETLEGQAETVASARGFVGDKSLIISPITLRRRPRPGQDPPPYPASDWRSSEDPRQATDFAAAWTLGSLASLAAAGVESVTYFEPAGPRGIMTSRADTWPTYHSFAAVAEFVGATVVPIASSQPLHVRAIGVRAGGRERVLIANLTPAPRTAELNGELSLGPFEILTIDRQI